MATSKNRINSGSGDGAYQEALRLLTYKQRTRKELSDRLARKGFSTKAVGEALARLASFGYVNDEEYARLWAAGAVERSRFGPIRIEMELRKRGIERDLARRAAGEAILDIGEEKLAREVLGAKVSREGLPGDGRDRRRLIGFLVRRGFTRSLAISAVMDLNAEGG